MRRFGTRVAACALVLALPACGGGSKPSTSPTPSQTQTPSPTPTLPSVTADKAAVKKALVSVKDLGKPWFLPKSGVNHVKATEGHLCPGQKNASARNKARAEASRQMTEGKQTGAAIGSFTVRAYGFDNEQKWRDAFAAADKACKSWKAVEGTYVTLETIASPPAVDGADEVLAHIERIYAERTHKTLYYVRHYYEVRTGRIVTAFEYAYIQPKSDPTGKDMTKSAKLLAEQVAKTRQTFGL
jgi:hypothetical protein